MKSKLLCFSSGAEGKRRCRLRQALGGREKLYATALKNVLDRILACQKT
jgi:hypothetical protein